MRYIKKEYIEFLDFSNVLFFNLEDIYTRIVIIIIVFLGFMYFINVLIL